MSTEHHIKLPEGSIEKTTTTLNLGPTHPATHGVFQNILELDGERITVTGHRDGAVYDRAIEQLLDDLDIAAVLVPGAPEPALQAAIAEGALALTTAPALFGAGVTVRPLEPTRVVGFEFLWRDETPSPALDAFIQMAGSCVEADAAGTARQPAVVA